MDSAERPAYLQYYRPTRPNVVVLMSLLEQDYLTVCQPLRKGRYAAAPE
jgi:hypothetical protein